MKIHSLKTLFAAVLCILAIYSCGGPAAMHNADEYTDIAPVRFKEDVTADNAASILDAYTLDFDIPNPFVPGGGPRRTVNPNHEETILCRAVLLDDYSTDADIMAHCVKDSLDSDECAEYRTAYAEEFIREDMFRIRLTMETGFAEKSLDPDHWIMYIENSEGVIIEPADITLSDVASIQDSMYSPYLRRDIPRRLMVRDVTLYFRKKTFFGHDLLGSENEYLALVITRETKTLARVVWNISLSQE